MNSQESDSLLKELNSIYDNLRAEVIIAEIEDHTCEEYDFLIKNDSSFTRSYKRDVISIQNSDDDSGCHIYNLSRNGLYDSLPESFFHGRSKKGSSFIAQRAQYKEEEKQARLLFSPLENEFFRQRLEIEKNEKAMLSEFHKLKDSFLIDFWKIDTEIPKKYLFKLIKLLPFAFKISGEIELARLCLENILGLQVIFKKKLRTHKINDIDTEEAILGVNMILPSIKPDIYTLSIDASIGPVKNNEVDLFLKEDGVLKFINLFYEYFMPVDVDVFTNIVAPTNSIFLLDDKDQPVLGVSTTI